MNDTVDHKISGYIADLVRLRSVVLTGSPDLDGSLASILPQVSAGVLSRSGVLTGGVRYKVHGLGCLFIDTDGVEVDVDFTVDGDEIFDWWRVDRNARSRGLAGSSSREEFTSAFSRLKNFGQLEEVRDGWYALRPTQ